jgi:pSer/pThr/pTyr-binding forkhead associated (FHA) protein
MAVRRIMAVRRKAVMLAGKRLSAFAAAARIRSGMASLSTITLSVVEGPDAPLSVSSHGRLSIGRAGHCDLSLFDGLASREHAVVVREGDDFVLVDLGSSNGTFVGEEMSRVSRQTLRDGDEVRVGQTFLKVSIRQPAEAKDASPVPQAPAPTPPVTARKAPPPVGSIALTIMSGPDQGRTFELTELQRVQIGRLPTCDVPLNDRLVSRLHATIRREGSGYAIYDENSANGLEVGTPPEKVSSAKLEDGMNLRLGVTEIRVAVADVRAAKSERTRVRQSTASRQSSAQNRRAPAGQTRTRRRSDLGL